ncbi:hypothetical protein OCH239_17110 [Roseivivax halodurans JCM 10272]|uniref:FAD dependent oxidoreductase domain-containing protein n=1 Tax=Roseivivax halodurans JCM 10272 TaxID=1449350 RepID=X7E9L6_9RHOB|nr:FAD-dependent oxidoreductase [Roseivivax halodurans]ETX12784.1 hypothetical protein OCH239_17110 [Roseivivax halodurans JCM 10272]
MQMNRFDVIVIGGGIHGLTIGLLAAEAGWRTLLIERRRLGGGATGGWFGILHGGLRYLQRLDILRFRASLVDSRWFLRAFPELVEPQPFLMPLYRRGLKRPAVMRAAMMVNRALGPDRNMRVPQAGKVPPGRVLSADDVARRAPLVPRTGLRGGALWHELVVPDGPALIAALAARARAAGLEIREGVEAQALRHDDTGRVTGLSAGGQDFEAPRIVNAAGSWAPELAGRFDPISTTRFAPPVLAFNLLIDRPPPAAEALSISDGTASDMLFLRPSGSRTFAGTVYLPQEGPADTARVPEGAIAAFLARIERALPGFGAADVSVVSVTSGLLPGTMMGETGLIDRDILLDHSAHGGPRGLVSLQGIKFTTAPSVAREVLRRACQR